MTNRFKAEADNFFLNFFLYWLYFFKELQSENNRKIFIKNNFAVPTLQNNNTKLFALKKNVYLLRMQAFSTKN
jgi:hypothetical protein